MTEPKDTSTDEIKVHLEYLREGVDEIKTHLRTQNGRLREAESDIADAKSDLAVLKDRGTRTQMFGAGGGMLGGLLAGFFEHWLSGK